MDSSNAQKYSDSNPVVRVLMGRFFSRARELVEPLAPQNVLDAGCGEGLALQELRPLLPGSITGFDMSETAVGHAQRTHPDGTFSVEDLYDLPYEDNAFDLVICMEVLEHLDDPGRGLRELKRVCSNHLLLSVPHEPFFQLGNFVRGKYPETRGNHPEHVQHWGKRSFRTFLEQELQGVQVVRSFPWLIARGRV